MNRSRRQQPSEPPKPGKITQIDVQQRDSARASIFIEGEFAFGLHLDLVLEHRLAEGDELDAGAIETLLAADAVKRAVIAGLNLIAHRPRARGELQQRLRSKGFDDAAAEAAVERLQDLGYLDDAAFAARWVENRQEHRPRSKAMLERELRQKGIDRQTIEETIAETDIDEVAAARELAEQKMRSMSGLDPETRNRRIGGMLARRGFGYDVIRKALNAEE